ncbi:MAG TPA: GNAT family N-acetyltransferase [Jatrophihabitans sp.]|nr:GNAT family N-acetyltransferase [Jatrophihabitans sp.]
MTTWNGGQLADLELRSARLLLRPWQAADAAEVTGIMRDRRMAEFLPLPQPYTAADAAEFVRSAASDTRLELAIVRDARLVGAIGMSLPDRHTGAEIGYWVRSADWGNGYATEAVRALNRFAFERGIQRTQIQADVGNLASVRVALRAGFSFEGIARLGGRSQRGPADRAMFARLATDSDGQVPPSWPEVTELTDGVVLLRKPRPEDWPILYAEHANPESQRWGFGDEYTEQAAIQRAEVAGLNWLVGRSADLVICDVATGAGAGMMNLRWGPPEVVGIGYGILPEFRGRRFTTRALRLLASWAFGQTSIVRLELGCKADNIASARSAELAGFVRDGRFATRLRNPDGGYSDEISFGLVRGQYRS